jgi:hypothetical protein
VKTETQELLVHVAKLGELQERVLQAPSQRDGLSQAFRVVLEVVLTLDGVGINLGQIVVSQVDSDLNGKFVLLFDGNDDLLYLSLYHDGFARLRAYDDNMWLIFPNEILDALQIFFLKKRDNIPQITTVYMMKN